MIKRTLLSQGMGLAKGIWGKITGGGVTPSAKQAIEAAVADGMDEKKAGLLFGNVGKNTVLSNALGIAGKVATLGGIAAAGELLLRGKNGLVGTKINELWTDAGKIEAEQNAAGKWHGIYKNIQELLNFFGIKGTKLNEWVDKRANQTEDKKNGRVDGAVPSGVKLDGSDNDGGSFPMGAAIGGAGLAAAYFGRGKIAEGVSKAREAFDSKHVATAGGPALKASNFDPADAAKIFQGGVDDVAEAAVKAGLKDKAMGAFRKNAVGAAVIGAGAFALNLAAGNNTAQAAENTAKMVLPFTDAAEKANHGDTAGAAKSATVEAVGIAGFIGGVAATTAMGAAAGSVVPVAGTFAGGVIGFGVGVVGSVAASGAAEYAWDKLSGAFSAAHDNVQRPALAANYAPPTFERHLGVS